LFLVVVTSDFIANPGLNPIRGRCLLIRQRLSFRVVVHHSFAFPPTRCIDLGK